MNSEKKLWAVLTRRIDGNGDEWVERCNSQEDALNRADSEWDHLTYGEQRETEVVAAWSYPDEDGDFDFGNYYPIRTRSTVDDDVINCILALNGDECLECVNLSGEAHVTGRVGIRVTDESWRAGNADDIIRERIGYYCSSRMKTVCTDRAKAEGIVEYIAEIDE